MIAWGALRSDRGWVRSDGQPRRSQDTVVPPGPAAIAVTGAVALLAVVVIVHDAVAWLARGAPIAPFAAAATAAALVLLLLAALWQLLPGRLGASATRGWPTVLAIALPLVAGPTLAVAVVLVATVCALVVERLRPAGFSMIFRDLVGVSAAGAALALTGAAGPPETPLLEAPVAHAITAALIVTLTFGSAHVAIDTLAGLAPTREGRQPWAALRRALRDNGLPLLVLLILGPVVAVLLSSSVWLAVVTLGAVSAVCALAESARGARGSDVDPLTGLLGREALQRAADRAVDLAVSGGPPVALLVVDLDRFQEVNDGHGHRTGDRVLRVVAQRLRAATRPHDVVARLGGDEFGILVPGVREVEDLVDLARRLRAGIGERIDGHEPLFGPGASVGIAVAPDHARTVSQLMARADLAVHGAKGSVSGIRVHEGRHDHTSAERLGMVTAVRSALDGDAVQLAYQPKVALAGECGESDRMAGVEALVRFTDPRHPGVEPGRVVPVVEGTGLMGRLTTAVLGRALLQAARWLMAGERIPVAVNVSLRDLEDPDFADRTYAALVHAGVPGSLLTLEITERVLTGDLSAVVRSMERLERIGVRLSLDDFGTGWSSLLLLRRLPVAEVKLDRSFVAGIARDDADAAVVDSVVALAHRLGLTMVAEGVEEPDQLARLRRAGCDVAQGYLLALPLPPEEVVPWAGRLGPARLRVVS